MKNALKIAAFALPMMALTANATPGNSKQNNYFKGSITATVLIQKGDSYSKSKVKTNDILAAILQDRGLNWNAKKCEIIMQLGPEEDVPGNTSWWIYYKDGKTAMKTPINGYIKDYSTNYVVYKRKYTAKGDNKKVGSEFSNAKVSITSDTLNMWANLSGTADLSIKGWKTNPYLNNAKYRASGNGSTKGYDPVEMSFKVKGRVPNGTFEGATTIPEPKA
jgi:hypothetical protein